MLTRISKLVGKCSRSTLGGLVTVMRSQREESRAVSWGIVVVRGWVVRWVMEMSVGWCKGGWRKEEREGRGESGKWEEGWEGSKSEAGMGG